jgi:hypothetical protein
MTVAQRERDKGSRSDESSQIQRKQRNSKVQVLTIEREIIIGLVPVFRVDNGKAGKPRAMLTF